MAKISKTIPQGYRYFFYVVVSCCFFSGTSFWLIREFFQIEGEFGIEPHSWQYPLLQLHGLMAFLMLMAIGAVITGHVTTTWYGQRAKKSGIALLTGISFSVISAYILYYWVSEETQEWLALLHLVFGCLLPILLILHITIARRTRKGSATRYS